MGAAADRGAGGAVSEMTFPAEFRWASERCANGMPHPEELEYFGFEKVGRDPRYPGSWLMRRDCA